MSTTGDLLLGLAGVLADAGIVTLRNDGSDYLPTETGVGYALLPDSPGRFVSLTAYGANSDNAVTPIGNQPVQVRMRGTDTPQDVDDLGDSIFAALHGLTNLTLGSIHLIQCLRISSVPLGMSDQSPRRWQRSDNYSIDVDYPGTVLRPY